MSSEPDSFGPVAPFYDELMAGVPYRSWARYLDQLWARHGQTPRTVLDVACGTGTLTRLLAAQGYDLVGVDLSAGMLERARQEAARARLPIDVRPAGRRRTGPGRAAV